MLPRVARRRPLTIQLLSSTVMVLYGVELLLLLLEYLVGDAHGFCPVKVAEHPIDPFLDGVTSGCKNDTLLLFQCLVV